MNKKLYESTRMRKMCVVSIIVLLIIQACTLITPKLMEVIIDEYIPNQNINGIIIGIILFVSIPCVYTVIQSVYTYFCYKIARNEGSEISVKIMKNLIDQRMSFFDEQNSVELATYSNKESYSYVFFYIWDIPQYYVSIISAIIIFILIFMGSPIVALLQLSFIPVVLLPMKLFGKISSSYIEEYLKVNATITQTRTDIFKNVKFIKLNRLEDSKIKEIESKNNSVVGIWGKISAMDSLRNVWSSGFVTMLYKGLTFGICAYLVLSNSKYSITIGTLVSLITYAEMFYMNLDQVFRSNIEEMKQNADYEKLFSYLNLSGESKEFEELDDIIEPCSIRIDNLNFCHENSDVMIHVDSLRMNPGEWIGIVGRSGIGKSTVFDLLEKIYETKDGSIYFGEQELHNINGFSIRDRVTRVSQDMTIFPGTIRDNMKLVCPNVSDEQLNEVLRVACLEDYVEALENGLDTVIGENGKLMSGGEKQRLALAQGLLRNSDVLLLDEVTSNVDNELEERIADNLNEYRKKHNITILSISHRLNFLKYADYIYEFGKEQV